MSKKVLTISVAAYNAEAFIDQALRSVCVDAVIDRLEIFVIDDGGTDGTLDIAKRYAERYPASVFPIHKENGGVFEKTIEVDGTTMKRFWIDTEKQSG